MKRVTRRGILHGGAAVALGWAGARLAACQQRVIEVEQVKAVGRETVLAEQSAVPRPSAR